MTVTIIAWVLRRLGWLCDRPRMLLVRLVATVERVDRALGDAAWACRFRADRIERGEVDDGIPF